jgi:hypothetical protein
MVNAPDSRRLFLILLAAALVAPGLGAQSRVGSDSSSRWQRYGHDLVYGTSLGLVYAAIDQSRNNPPEWGNGLTGFEKRTASNVGEFVVQETTTDILAAAMDRPLDYQRCHCDGVAERFAWATIGAVADPLPEGKRALAVPRIVGAFAGSFAQAAWRPRTGSVVSAGLTNGAMSLLIGAGINLFYEFR